MEKKLLVCDLDGTLLDTKNQIDDTSLSKLKSYISEGDDFCVCTGRLDEDIKYVENQLNVKGAYRISQNGAVVRDQDNNLVSLATIPQDLVPAINKIVFNRGLRVEVSDLNHRYFPSPRDPGSVAEFVDTSIVKSDLPAFVQGGDFHPVIYLIFGDNESFKPIIAALSEVVGGKVNVQQTSPSSLEIFSLDASKGTAVASIMKKLDFPSEQLYVAGDAQNDTTMFPLTTNSFAVGKLADEMTISKATYRVNSIGELIDQMKVGES